MDPLAAKAELTEAVSGMIEGRAPRNGQIESIYRLVYKKKDCVLVAATGYGKSIVLFACARLTNKLTIQIVPLTKLGQSQLADITNNIPEANPTFIDAETPLRVSNIIVLILYNTDIISRTLKYGKKSAGGTIHTSS